MPAVNSVARFEPGLPGSGKVTLMRFNAQQNLGPEYASCIELIVVRKNEARLDNWVSPNQDGFLTIIPRNARQRAQDFEFEVGPEVVNPMAFDNTGDYILRIRDHKGIIISFNLSMNGTPRADTAYVPKVQPASAPPQQGIAGGYEPPRSSSAQANPAFNAGAAGATGADSAGSSSSGIGSKIAKVLAALVLLGIIGAGATYFMGMWNLDGLLGSQTAQEEPQEEEELALTEEDKQNAQEADESSESTESATAATPASSPCVLAGKTGNAQEILSNCLRSSPTTEQVNSFLKEALQTGQCEIATKLLSARGRGAGGGNYAYLYALLSDPNSRLTSSCVPKDAKNAEYWMNHAKRDQSFTEAEGQKLIQSFLQ